MNSDEEGASKHVSNAFQAISSILNQGVNRTKSTTGDFEPKSDGYYSNSDANDVRTTSSNASTETKHDTYTGASSSQINDSVHDINDGDFTKSASNDSKAADASLSVLNTTHGASNQSKNQVSGSNPLSDGSIQKVWNVLFQGTSSTSSPSSSKGAGGSDTAQMSASSGGEDVERKGPVMKYFFEQNG